MDRLFICMILVLIYSVLPACVSQIDAPNSATYSKISVDPIISSYDRQVRITRYSKEKMTASINPHSTYNHYLALGGDWNVKTPDKVILSVVYRAFQEYNLLTNIIIYADGEKIQLPPPLTSTYREYFDHLGYLESVITLSLNTKLLSQLLRAKRIKMSFVTKQGYQQAQIRKFSDKSPAFFALVALQKAIDHALQSLNKEYF